MLNIFFDWVFKGTIEWNIIDNLMFWLELFIVIVVGFAIYALILEYKEKKTNKKKK